MDTMITTYNTAVTDAASEILGKERRRKKPWVTKDVLDLCDERRDLKKKRYEAEGAKEYREANRKIQKAVKKPKEDWIGAQCEEIETCLNKNNSKRAYQLVKDITSEKQGRSSTIQDKSGKCLTEEKEILSRWTEYFSKLYNYERRKENPQKLTQLSSRCHPRHLERIMSDALEEHGGKVSIGGRNITNLRFADDIYALAEEEQELEALVESLDKTCTRYKMEISAEKTKLMTNSANGIQREMKVKGQKLGTVTSFNYLRAVVSDDGSKPEVLSMIAQATAALTKLKPIWRDNNISLGSKVKLVRSLFISIFLYACESWT